VPDEILAPKAEMRCCCGNLLARLVSGSVEVKCRRCKRTVLLPLEVDSSSR
jgi:phage FluMu protein Com